VRVSRPALVIELSPSTADIIGDTGWGIGALLAEQQPGTHILRLSEQDTVPDTLPGDRTVVLAVRDAHRHPWIAATLSRLLSAHPDIVVVEMGVLVTPIHSRYVATHGASRASAIAAVEVLLGRNPA
jgi:beta-N-acetylhexosaminidase